MQLIFSFLFSLFLSFYDHRIVWEKKWMLFLPFFLHHIKKCVSFILFTLELYPSLSLSLSLSPTILHDNFHTILFSFIQLELIQTLG